MTTLNKTIDKPVIEDVYEILDKAQSDNEKIPALRVIRATIGVRGRDQRLHFGRIKVVIC